jgi:hypothetical protein
LGMHRSGTSFITKVLNELGLFVGNDLNLHHESTIHVELNDFILFSAHSAWDYPLNIERLIENKLSFNNTTEYLKDMSNHWLFKYKYWGIINWIMRNEIKIPWGWKEPRTTITFPFWLKLFPKAKFIFIYRNGIDVADSLYNRELKREGHIKNKAYSLRCLNIEEAFELWVEYNSLFLKYKHLINNDDIICFSYEDFIESPLTIIDKISGMLKINFDIKNASSLNKMEKDKKYKFIKEKKLVELYEKNKNHEIMRYFNYDTINNFK